MAAQNAPERMLFTFQYNGEVQERRMTEIVAEHLVIHEAPVGEDVERRSWFGPEDELPELLSKIGFAEIDVEGVLAGLRVNRVETREVETVSEALNGMGFAAKDELPAAR